MSTVLTIKHGLPNIYEHTRVVPLLVRFENVEPDASMTHTFPSGHYSYVDQAVLDNHSFVITDMTHQYFTVRNVSATRASCGVLLHAYRPEKQPTAIPENPLAAKYLFRAIAYAEEQLGLPKGSAFPDITEDGCWVLIGQVDGVECTFRLSAASNFVNRTYGNNLYVRGVTKDGHVIEHRSHSGSIVAVDNVIDQIQTWNRREAE